jgi:hypothetical protein
MADLDPTIAQSLHDIAQGHLPVAEAPWRTTLNEVVDLLRGDLSRQQVLAALDDLLGGFGLSVELWVPALLAGRFDDLPDFPSIGNPDIDRLIGSIVATTGAPRGLVGNICLATIRATMAGITMVVNVGGESVELKF